MTAALQCTKPFILKEHLGDQVPFAIWSRMSRASQTFIYFLYIFHKHCDELQYTQDAPYILIMTRISCRCHWFFYVLGLKLYIDKHTHLIPPDPILTKCSTVTTANWASILGFQNRDFVYAHYYSSSNKLRRKFSLVFSNTEPCTIPYAHCSS